MLPVKTQLRGSRGHKNFHKKNQTKSDRKWL